MKLIINWKVLCRHLTKVSLTLVVHLLLDYLYALFDLVFPSYTFNQSVFIKATIASTRHRWFSGRILTYQAEARVRFPPVRQFSLIWIRKNVSKLHRTG